MDDLIGRLRERVADPKPRTDAPQSLSFSGPGGSVTTEERRAVGLPEVGWERVVWGGLGLDDDG